MACRRKAEEAAEEERLEREQERMRQQFSQEQARQWAKQAAKQASRGRRVAGWLADSHCTPSMLCRHSGQAAICFCLTCGRQLLQLALPQSGSISSLMVPCGCRQGTQRQLRLEASQSSSSHPRQQRQP